MSYFGWILLLFVLAMINTAIAFSAGKNFLANHTTIDSPRTFATFKQLARTQMIHALVNVIFVLPMGFLGGYGIVTHRLNTKEFVVFLLLNGVIFLLAKMCKGTEERARSMKVIDPVSEDQYRAVCHSWVHKALPDF